MELLSRLELPNLFLTKEVLYLLSYNSMIQGIPGSARSDNRTIFCVRCQQICQR